MVQQELRRHFAPFHRNRDSDQERPHRLQQGWLPPYQLGHAVCVAEPGIVIDVACQFPITTSQRRRRSSRSNELELSGCEFSSLFWDRGRFAFGFIIRKGMSEEELRDFFVVQKCPDRRDLRGRDDRAFLYRVSVHTLFQSRPALESILAGDYKLRLPQRQGILADLCVRVVSQAGQVVLNAGTGRGVAGAMSLAQFFRLQLELGKVKASGGLSSHSDLLSHSARCPRHSGGKKNRITNTSSRWGGTQSLAADGRLP